VTELTRVAAEDFLYEEAALIDERRFDEWLALFADDGLYWVPGDDPDLDPTRQVSIIYDDATRRRSRVERLQHRSNWRDDPEGRLLHLVSNVRISGIGADGAVEVRSNQLVTHSRSGRDVTVAVACTHRLRRTEGRWLIVLKKVCLMAAEHYLPPGAIVLL